MHRPSLIVFAIGAAISVGLAFSLRAQSRARERAAFDAETTTIVANLRSAFELPLEVVESTAALFEASRDVTRAEFARFVKPALERYPGVRALEWIPVVPASERLRYETAARSDGLEGFQFRQRNARGEMVPAAARDEYLPIYFMEPGHPLVLGFDCASEPQRRASADRARTTGKAVASERIQLIDDPPSVTSIAVFQPVLDPGRPRASGSVLGFAVEVFRVRVVAEHAIEESLRRGIQVLLLDLGAPPEKRVLFESAPELASRPPAGPRFETTLHYADRLWSIALYAGASGAGGLSGTLRGPGFWALGTGLTTSALLAFGLAAGRMIHRLRRQVHAAQQLGQYTLLDKLGEGGVGIVYRARHAMLRRPTAIKLLGEATRDPTRLARFEREVQLTSELSHPNTIAIYDYGRTPEGVFYYAMEHIEGITLEQLVTRDGPCPPGRVVRLLEQACGALAEAHAVGLVHRDIKPANLMICRRGGIPDFLKVMDFGLVKDIGGGAPHGGLDEITRSTATTVLGTPLYLSPEAISRPAEIDGRADLYALGAVAYFLLVGQPPFTGQSLVEVFGHHLHSPAPRPSERLGRAIPRSLEEIVARCLQKAPDARFATAGALLAALRGAVDVAPWTDGEAEQWWKTRGDALVATLRAEQAAAASGSAKRVAPDRALGSSRA